MQPRLAALLLQELFLTTVASRVVFSPRASVGAVKDIKAGLVQAPAFFHPPGHLVLVPARALTMAKVQAHDFRYLIL